MATKVDVLAAIERMKQRLAAMVNALRSGTVPASAADFDELLAAIEGVYPATATPPAPTPSTETEAERNARLAAEVEAANHTATPPIRLPS